MWSGSGKEQVTDLCRILWYEKNFLPISIRLPKNSAPRCYYLLRSEFALPNLPFLWILYQLFITSTVILIIKILVQHNELIFIYILVNLPFISVTYRRVNIDILWVKSLVLSVWLGFETNLSVARRNLWSCLRLSKFKISVNVIKNVFIALQKVQVTFIRKSNLFTPFTIITVAYFECQIKLINMLSQ